MKLQQLVEENSRDRRRQLVNFASLAGVSKSTMIDAFLKRSEKPWSLLRASQKRGRLLSNQFMASFNISTDGSEEYRHVAWRSLFMPTEIIHAMGIIPFTTEMVAAQLAMSGWAIGRLETAEGDGYSQDLCSFIRASAGAVLEDMFPTPDIFLTSSHVCDPSANFAGYCAHRYSRPEFVLDIPYGIWEYGDEGKDKRKIERAVDYVAGQLEEMVEFITRYTGIVLDEERLRQSVEWSNQARAWLLEGNTFAKDPANRVNAGSGDLHFAANVMQTWGTEKIVDVYKSRYQEFVTASKSAHGDSEKPRIFWIHLTPYYQNRLLSYIDEKVDITGSQGNTVFWEECDAADPFRSIARKTVTLPIYASIAPRAKYCVSLLHPGDGVIAFFPKSCRHFHASARIEGELLKQAGVPMLVIDGDCIDSRGDDFMVVKTRIDRFIKSMKS